MPLIVPWQRLKYRRTGFYSKPLAAQTSTSVPANLSSRRRTTTIISSRTTVRSMLSCVRVKTRKGGGPQPSFAHKRGRSFSVENGKSVSISCWLREEAPFHVHDHRTVTALGLVERIVDSTSQPALECDRDSRASARIGKTIDSPAPSRPTIS